MDPKSSQHEFLPRAARDASLDDVQKWHCRVLDLPEGQTYVIEHQAEYIALAFE